MDNIDGLLAKLFVGVLSHTFPCKPMRLLLFSLCESRRRKVSNVHGRWWSLNSDSDLNTEAEV